MIYVNNAATSFPKPPEVIEAVRSSLEKPFVDTGRSQFSDLSRIEACRANIAAFFGIPNPNRLVFTSGATESLNMALRGLPLSEGDTVLSTAIEHNSVVRPLKHLEKEKGIRLTFAPCDRYGQIDPDALFEKQSPAPRCVVVNHCSNVTGAVVDIAAVCARARERGTISVIDCSQSAGSIPIDVSRIGPDILVAAGHKNLFGYPGIGVLYVREGVYLSPIKTGGTGIRSESVYQPEEYPLYLEAGTKNLLGILSLDAGVRYIRQEGIETIRAKKAALTAYLFERLESLPNITLQSTPMNCEGTLSFTVQGYSPDEVGAILERNYGVVARTGLHCAPLIHRYLGTDRRGGTVRVSLSPFNTFEELEAICDCLRAL